MFINFRNTRQIFCALIISLAFCPGVRGQWVEALIDIQSTDGRSFQGKILGMESDSVVKFKHANGSVYSLSISSLSGTTRRRVAEWKADAESRAITIEGTDGRSFAGSIVGLLGSDMVKIRRGNVVLTIPQTSLSAATRERIAAWKKTWEASATSIVFDNGGTRLDRIITLIKGAVVVEQLDGEITAIPLVNLSSETLNRIFDWRDGNAAPSAQTPPGIPPISGAHRN